MNEQTNQVEHCGSSAGSPVSQFADIAEALNGKTTLEYLMSDENGVLRPEYHDIKRSVAERKANGTFDKWLRDILASA